MSRIPHPAWEQLTHEQLAERLSKALSMLRKIAGEKEVWSVYQVNKVIKEITAGLKNKTKEEAK